MSESDSVDYKSLGSDLKSDLRSQLTSEDSGSRLSKVDKKRMENLSQKAKDRFSKTFNPYDDSSGYNENRSRYSKVFGGLTNFSMRTGSLGIISAMLGTGVLALPNGIAHFGWVNGIIAILISAMCHLYSFYLLTGAQSCVIFLFL